MTPDAYQWPTDPRISILEAEANTLAACLIHLLADTRNRELDSQRDQP